MQRGELSRPRPPKMQPRREHAAIGRRPARLDPDHWRRRGAAGLPLALPEINTGKLPPGRRFEMFVVRPPTRRSSAPSPHALIARAIRVAPAAGDERGQALIETALTLPLLLLVMIGLLQCGVLFNNWVTLTDAVRAGSRQLAISRAPGQNACTLAESTVRTAAPGLIATDLKVTWTVTDSCTSLLAGSEATLKATYPCKLSILGVDYIPNCSIKVQTTERVE
jgi:hypothetical protein